MFENKIMALAEQSKAAIKDRSSERATDTYVIQPFIRALGYDTSNPEEVKPEFYADIGTKKGEKVDYALLINNAPVIIIEIKAITESLNSHHHSQLFRYFTTTDVRIAILTNGREAWFYSDLNKTNVMDDAPFFKFDFQDNLPEDRIFLENFYRNKFQINEIIKEASMRKDLQKVKAYIQNHVINPSDEFIRFIGKEINGGMPRRDMIEPLKASIKSAFEDSFQNKYNIRHTNFNPSNQFKNNNTTSLSSSATIEEFLDEYKILNDFRFLCSEPAKTIFKKFIAEIEVLKARYKPSQTCIKYYKSEEHIAKKKAFISILPRKLLIQIGLDIEDKSEIYDPKNLCENRPSPNKLGIGNVLINIDEARVNRNLNDIMQIVQQVYNLNPQEFNSARQANEHVAFANSTHRKTKVAPSTPVSIQGTWLEKYYHPNYRRFIHQEPVKSLFEQYIMEMQKLGDEKINQIHVAYCTRSNHTFSAIQEYAQGIKIWLNIEEIDQINDPRGICNAIGFNEFGVRKHHTGIGQVFILVTRDSDHDYIMGLVKQIYNKQT